MHGRPGKAILPQRVLHLPAVSPEAGRKNTGLGGIAAQYFQIKCFQAGGIYSQGGLELFQRPLARQGAQKDGCGLGTPGIQRKIQPHPWHQAFTGGQEPGLLSAAFRQLFLQGQDVAGNGQRLFLLFYVFFVVCQRDFRLSVEGVQHPSLLRGVLI